MEIKLHAKQEEALATLKKTSTVLYGGARGGGKSFLVRAWQVMRRLTYPGTTGVIIRKVYPELLTNHIDQMWLEYPELKQYYNKADKVIEFPSDPVSKLYFRHLQNPDDVYNYQGQEFGDIALDEAGQHQELTFRILSGSNRNTKSEMKPRMLLTANPGGPGHAWVKRLFVERRFIDNERPDDYAFVPSSVYDNPTLMLGDPDYVNKLKALPEQLRRAYLDGDWNVFVGQFFTEFRNEKHVIKPRFDYRKAPSTWDYVLCWDEGTLRPRAVYILAQDNDGRVEVIWEYYKTGETAVEAIQNIVYRLGEMGILDMLRRNGKFVYDPSMDIMSNQTGISTSLIVNGYLQMRKEPANNERVEGARVFREYLHWDSLNEPLLRIWDTCTNLIEEIPSLVHSENRKGEDIDSNSNDHGYDSVRYGIMSLRKHASRIKNPRRITGFEADLESRMEKKTKVKYVNPITGY